MTLRSPMYSPALRMAIEDIEANRPVRVGVRHRVLRVLRDAEAEGRKGSDKGSAPTRGATGGPIRARNG